MRKFILNLLLFLLSLNIIFSENIDLNVEVENDDISDIYLTNFLTNKEGVNYNSNILEEIVDETSFSSKNFTYSYAFSDIIYQVFFYPTSTEDYVLEVDDFGLTDTIDLKFNKYQNNDYASNYTCVPTIKSFNENEIVVSSNLENLHIYSHETNPKSLKEVDISELSDSDKNRFNEILNKYYYPKTSVKKILQKYNESSEEFEDFTEFNIENALSKDNYENYTILNETEKTFTFEGEHIGVNDLEPDNPGVYRYKYEAKVIDLKCDLDNDGSLSSTESIENYTLGEEFEAFDTESPKINSVYPDEDSFDFNNAQNVVFQINASDNVLVDKVYLNITSPDLSVDTNLEAIYNSNTGFYEYDFSFKENLFGDYNYTIFVNDTSSNINTTTSKFSVYDEVLPVINDFMNEKSFEKQKDFDFTIEVVDKFTESVFVEIYSSTGGVTSSKYLTQVDGTDNYTTVFNLNNNREYSYNIIAKDYSLNEVVQSGVLNILNEIENPEVSDINYNGEDYNISNEKINLTADITDEFGIYLSQINITYPNGTNNLYNMEILSGDTYFYEFELPNLVGIYNFEIIAKDNNGNINDTEKGSFNLVDDIFPQITFSKPTENTFEVFDNITFEIEATDNFNVSNSKINITFNEVSNIYEMENYNPIFNYTYETSNIGTLNYSFIVEDENSNVNQSETFSIEIVDRQNPQTEVIEPSLSSYWNTQTIDLILNNTDNLEILNSTAKIYFEGNNIEDIVLVEEASGFYEGEYSFNVLNFGEYEIIFLTYDTSNNLNQTSVSFEVTDATVPLVTIENLESDDSTSL